MKNISIKIKKYLKINLIFLFVLGFFLPIIINNKEIFDFLQITKNDGTDTDKIDSIPTKEILLEFSKEEKTLIKDAKKIIDKENEILEINENSGFSHTDFNDDGSLIDDSNDEKIKAINEWLKKPNLDNKIRKSLIKNIFNNNHKNIIRLAKLWKNYEWESVEVTDFQFLDLLGIIHPNSLSFDSFEENENILDSELNNLSSNKYDAIKKWFDISDEFSNELIDRKNNVINQIKKELSKYFNIYFNSENKDKFLIKKDIAKLITEIYEVPDNFFSDTGLTKGSFEISEYGIGQMQEIPLWNITLETSLENLNNYKSWIDFLNEDKYKELLIQKIIELLKRNSNYSGNNIIKAKNNPDNADKTLELHKIDGISHTDFNDDGSLQNDLSKEKLILIKNWLNISEESDEKSWYNKWYIWIVLIAIIAFIGYNSYKKKKTEKKEQIKREEEVKIQIKKHLLKDKNLKNISVNFIKVIPRIGKIYRYRDVFDVFVEIYNTKTKTLIEKKIFEIEGVALQTGKKNQYDVDWFINKEFKYKEHMELIEKIPSSKWKVYLRSLWHKGNKKEWRQTQLKKIKLWEKEQNKRHKNILESKKNKKEIFKPKTKKRESKDNI